MKKAERIEVGKECVHKMIDGNLSYSDLEMLSFNGEYFGKDTLKKCMDLYIEQESVENPDNPVIAEYQAYKTKRVKFGLNKLTINKILAETIEEFGKSLEGLSTAQIKRRLDVLTSDDTKAAQVSDYIKVIDDYLKNLEKAKNEKHYTSDSETFDNKINYIIDLYINSPVIELQFLKFDPSVMSSKTFLNQVKLISNESANGGDKYSTQIKSKVAALLAEVKRREEEARDEITLIVNYIINGIPKAGKTESFTLFDYYSLTKYSVPDLAAAAVSLSKDENDPLVKCASALTGFRDRVYKNDYRTNKDNIIKYQYTENGRVLFGDEIDAIIDYLKARNIPLTQRTYQGAYHEYVNGRLQIKQI